VSRWWPRPVRVTLRPESAGGAQLSWQDAVKSLPGLVGARRAEVSITLSNRFARYFALPWSAALAAEADWRGFAERRFETLFGARADAHAILLSASSRSARLACAVERALLEAIRGALEAAGHRLASLRPQFAASFDPARREIGAQDAWCVSQEPGQLTIGLALAGDWRAVRQRRVAADWEAELPGILERESQLAGLEAPLATAYLARFDHHAPARLRLR
jgi:hypothetical protein